MNTRTKTPTNDTTIINGDNNNDNECINCECECDEDDQNDVGNTTNARTATTTRRTMKTNYDDETQYE